MPMSDEKILTALSADKREGVRLLFERYYRPLVLSAGELLEDQVEAEDIVQDFFVNLWEDDYLLRIKANALSSYMFVSVRNRCYTHLRRNDILRNKVDIADIDVAADSAAALSQEIVDRVTAEINKLPAQTAKVLSCVLLDDMKYQECAASLDISVNTVKSLLRVGMAALREAMKGDRDLVLLHIFCYSRVLPPDTPLV